MLCVIIAQQHEKRLALEALENAGLADPANRELAKDEVMFFTPHAETALRGMILEGDDVYFMDGWDRNLRENARYEFKLTLQLAGANPDECGRLVA